MNTHHLKLCAWTGPIFFILFIIGYVFLAGFLPPPDPSLSAEAIAAIYRDNSLSIRSGLVVMMVATAFLIPFQAAVAVQMRNMNSPSLVLILTFLIASAVVIAVFFIIYCAWGVASFRPNGLPEITQAFNDFAFIMFIWPTTVLPISYIALGLATLADKQEQPIFPRWFAYLNFWMALLALGGTLLIFFKTGPFAWNGLIAFWVAAAAFFGWYITTAVLLVRSTYRQQRSTISVDDNL